MSKTSTIVTGVVAILVIGALGWFLHGTTSPKAGDSANANSSTPYQCVGSVCDWKVAAQCGQPAGTIASSTLFAVQNPWGATSTLTGVTVQGLNGATTTDFLVGTSTTPAPAGLFVATSSVGKSLISMYNIAANANFFTTAGVTLGPSTGYQSPSGGTYPTSVGSVVVGPTDYVLGFSTSTNPANSAATGLNVPVSCNYTMIFRRGF